MDAKLMTATRKKILVYWYLYHKETNLWPSYSEAEIELDISANSISYHVKILVKAEWMIKKKEGKQVALTKDVERYLHDKEMIAVGKKRKEINIIRNRIKHANKNKK